MINWRSLMIRAGEAFGDKRAAPPRLLSVLLPGITNHTHLNTSRLGKIIGRDDLRYEVAWGPRGAPAEIAFSDWLLVVSRVDNVIQPSSVVENVTAPLAEMLRNDLPLDRTFSLHVVSHPRMPERTALLGAGYGISAPRPRVSRQAAKVRLRRVQKDGETTARPCRRIGEDALDAWVNHDDFGLSISKTGLVPAGDGTTPPRHATSMVNQLLGPKEAIYIGNDGGTKYHAASLTLLHDDGAELQVVADQQEAGDLENLDALLPAPGGPAANARAAARRRELRAGDGASYRVELSFRGTVAPPNTVAWFELVGIALPMKFGIKSALLHRGFSRTAEAARDGGSSLLLARCRMEEPSLVLQSRHGDLFNLADNLMRCCVDRRRGLLRVDPDLHGRCYFERGGQVRLSAPERADDAPFGDLGWAEGAALIHGAPWLSRTPSSTGILGAASYSLRDVADLEVREEVVARHEPGKKVLDFDRGPSRDGESWQIWGARSDKDRDPHSGERWDLKSAETWAPGENKTLRDMDEVRIGVLILRMRVADAVGAAE